MPIPADLYRWTYHLDMVMASCSDLSSFHLSAQQGPTPFLATELQEQHRNIGRRRKFLRSMQ
eukprot:gene1484-12603_t